MYTYVNSNTFFSNSPLTLLDPGFLGLEYNPGELSKNHLK